MSDYDFALTLHHRIVGMYREVADADLRFRRPEKVSPRFPVPPGFNSKVEADRVFCALAIKGATTKQSILTLCEEGDGDNALVLSRVLIELGVLMNWLLGGAGRDRLHTDMLFSSVIHERIIEIVNMFFEDRPAFLAAARSKSDPYHRAIARSVFGGNTNSWAYFPVDGKPGKLKQVKIVEMFRETDGEFAYAMPYARGSQVVHSGPESILRTFRGLLGQQCFCLAPANDSTLCGEAMSLGNFGMLHVLGALDEYIGLDWSERLKAVADDWYAYAKLSHSAEGLPRASTHAS